MSTDDRGKLSCDQPVMVVADDGAGEEVRAWCKWQLVASLSRSVASMCLMPVVPIVVAALHGDPSKVAEHNADLTFWGSGLQILLFPFFAVLSDRFGRKPFLCGCGAAQAAWCAMVCVAHDRIGPRMFLVADIANRSAALLAVVLTNAALGDVVPPSSLASAVGRHTGVAFGASMLCGPPIGTFAHARLGGVPAAAGLAFAFALLSLLVQSVVVRESLAKPARSGSLQLRGVNPASGLCLVFRGGGARLALLGCAHGLFKITAGEQVLYSAFMLDVWGLGTRGIALSTMLVGVAVALGQAAVVATLSRRLGAARALDVALWAATFQRVCFGFFAARSRALAALSLLVGMPSFGFDALIGQLATEATGGSIAKGELMAALNSVSTVAVLLSSKLLAWLFVRGNAVGMPGAPFLFGAACCVASLVAARTGRRPAAYKPKAS